MSPGLGAEVLVALALISVLGGVIVATVGPGGIFVITGLYLLTGLSSPEIAGTASATFTVGAILGSLAFARSGEMDWHLAGVVGAAGALGTWFGVQANAVLSRALFGIILATLLSVVGCTIVYREYRDLEPRVELATEGWELAAFGAIGLGIGFFGGLLGIGGAALSVPALVLVGVPMLVAIAVTQVVVGFITFATTLNYLLLGAVVTPLVFLTAGTYLTGVGIGWRLAHRIDAERLKLALGVVLLGLAASLVI